MAGDNESIDPQPSSKNEHEILRILKEGFETEHVLQRRVRAQKADAEPEADVET
jgi:hypothetical protein